MEDRRQICAAAKCSSAPAAAAAPVVCYRLRSWCNRWLSCSASETELAKFSDDESDASEFFLLPLADGNYKLQLRGADFDPKPWIVCTRGRSVGCSSKYPDNDTAVFTLELHEHGGVAIRSIVDNRYLSSDRTGCLWSGAIKLRKGETFTLVEQPLDGIPEGFPWVVQAPVRVTLQTCFGKYLCAAKPVVCACAEAPCCCEEFILDLSFSAVPLCCDNPRSSKSSLLRSGFLRTLSILGYQKGCEPHKEQASSYRCTIRTANGSGLLSAETDGSVFTTNVARAQGREAFFLDLHPDRTNPRIRIQQAAAEGRYFSSEFGFLVNKKPLKKDADYFNIQLANGSEVLMRSVHGGFLGVAENSGGCRTASICAWQLRSHGDSLFTLISTSVSGRRADQYMFADNSGRLYQSCDPSVHFPAAASLFEVKPVTEACISDSCTGSSRIAGFTIRTVLKINGKRRFLSVEPNGSVTAVRHEASRWELFQLIDVDAAAAAAAPDAFSCTPAAFKLQPPGHMFPRSSVRKASSGRSMNKVCEVAAKALQDGLAVPKRSSMSLQELCIAQVCCHASEMREPDMSQKLSDSQFLPPESELSELVSLLCSVTGRNELLPISIPTVISESGLGIPDDLLSRVWSAHRLRQVPTNSCKWMPSAFIPPPPQQPYARVHRFGARVHQRVTASEGWHCSSCDVANVLPMDAAVNPAHHRYLEVQSRVYSRAIQSTGILWNLISLAGVSIMSTALFCQLKAAASRRSIRPC